MHQAILRINLFVQLNLIKIILEIYILIFLIFVYNQ
jgi:hypothetical protein